MMAIDIFSLPGFILHQPPTADPYAKAVVLNHLAKNLENYRAWDLKRIAEKGGQVSLGECLSFMTSCLAEIIKKPDEHEDVRLAALSVMRAVARTSYDAYEITLDEVSEIKSTLLNNQKVRKEVLKLHFSLTGKQLPKRSMQVAVSVATRGTWEVAKLCFAFTA